MDGWMDGWMDGCIHSFIHSFIHLFIDPFIHSFIVFGLILFDFVLFGFARRLPVGVFDVDAVQSVHSGGSQARGASGWRQS